MDDGKNHGTCGRIPDLPEKVKIAAAVFSYDGNGTMLISRWFHESYATVLANHPRVDFVKFEAFVGYPAPRVRNKALQVASAEGFDFLLMLDNDMHPDVECTTDPKAVPFFPSVLDFMLRHDGPCVVGAPYCASPPKEDCIVMKWESIPANNAILPAEMKRYSRREAALATGFEEVPALPTGVMLIDLRVLRTIVPPFFDYEFTTESEVELAATEDVVFTRNLSFIGIPQYVAWDSWAGHLKTVCVRKPRLIEPQQISRMVKKAWKLQYGIPLDKGE